MTDIERPKLHKVLAQAGLGSRLDMEKAIAEGRVSVDGQVAHVGQRINGDERIRIDGKPVRVNAQPAKARVLAYHKPVGEVVTHSDPQSRPTVFQNMPRIQRGKWLSVGRLDINTEGLLLVTNSGDLANRLMHPSFGLLRVYAARVMGALTEEERQRLLDGIDLDDGVAKFEAIEDERNGEGLNCWYQVTIAEGRNREVRRMFDAVGHVVSRLIRVRYGSVALPRGLARGKWVELSPKEVDALASSAGMKVERPRPAVKKAVGRSSVSRGRSVGPRPATPRAPSAPTRGRRG